MTDITPAVLSQAQAARYLKRRKSRVHELCVTGEIDGARDGRDWRILRESCDAYLKREFMRNRSEQIGRAS